MSSPSAQGPRGRLGLGFASLTAVWTLDKPECGEARTAPRFDFMPTQIAVEAIAVPDGELMLFPLVDGPALAFDYRRSHAANMA